MQLFVLKLGITVLVSFPPYLILLCHHSVRWILFFEFHWRLCMPLIAHESTLSPKLIRNYTNKHLQNSISESVHQCEIYIVHRHPSLE
ncbi:hypothetical protein OPV22_024875 [Ensete ventricosum]|uniref:Secreted protein n=1 Tax=Ensete ventricosum TaxID=4639 RepID=A0AAV8QE38_ENSVE|nr:hypothetical protein OPV22_024875 [Ensete ventricosum]